VRTTVISLTFALSVKSGFFSAGFLRPWLARADPDAWSGVVETYPLELAVAELG
jgi:hypothetical protein